jgi:translation initiation factor IF-3
VEEDKPPMNDQISFSEIRVMAASSSGGKDEALGIMSKADALAKAKELGGLDLILINENSDPPVCKIVDYSKYRYMKEKKAKEVKKNSKVSEIKEVKMSYKIDVHDYEVRKKNAARFLSQGNRVKCTVMFRGREVTHDQLGFELLEKLSEDLDRFALREGKAKREGRNLALILSPRPEVMKAVSDSRRAEEKAKKKKKEESLKEKRGAQLGPGAALTAAAEAAATAEVEADDLLRTLVIEEEEGLDSFDLSDVGEDDDEEDESAFDKDEDDGEDDDGDYEAADLLSALKINDDDDGEDVSAALDALLGKDSLTDDLFS